MNPKGHATSSLSVNPSEPVREVNVIISLSLGREMNTQVGNSNKPCKYPYNFFQILLIKKLVHRVSQGMLLMVSSMILLILCLLSHVLIKRNLKRKILPIDSVDPSSPNDFSSPSSAERVHKPLPPFPNRMKKKDQAHVDRCGRLSLNSKSASHCSMRFNKFLSMLHLSLIHIWRCRRRG